MGEEIVYAKHVVVITKAISATEQEYRSVMSVLTNSGEKCKLYLLDFIGETQDVDESSKSATPPVGEGNGRFVMYKGTKSVSI